MVKESKSEVKDKKQKSSKPENKKQGKTKSKALSKGKNKSKLKMLNNLSIIAPLFTEKSVVMVDTQNTLVFYVKRNARKEDIKKDVEVLLNVKVDNVRTMIDMKGRKKAFVRINEDYLASDLAASLGMM